MYNYDDIIARLRAGEDSEVIAKEMVDTLNRANRDFVDEMEAAKKAESEAQKTKQKKAEMLKEMMNTLEVYVREFHPENPMIEMFDSHTPGDMDELVEQIDAAIDGFAVAAQITKKIEADLAELFKDGAPKAVRITPTGKGDAIAPKMDNIAAFLKANGLA